MQDSKRIPIWIVLHIAVAFWCAVAATSHTAGEQWEGDVSQFADELLSLVGSMDAYERAAFLIRHDGRVRLLEWPFRRTFKSARWEGPVPGNAIAVIHTHPNGSPRPSIGDADLARTLGVPVYAVTRSWICVAHPAGAIGCERRLQ